MPLTSQAFYGWFRSALAVSRDSRLSPQRRARLEEVLSSRKEQAVWADTRLRAFAVDLVSARFRDDDNWCVQVLIAISFLNPGTVDRIAEIVGEHEESRLGSFEPRLYRDQGWNPADALTFDADPGVYWRCYRAYTATAWTSFEMLRAPEVSSQLWTQSGYKFSGVRGCVLQLELTQDVEGDHGPADVQHFVSKVGRVISRAGIEGDASTLYEAIGAGRSYETALGFARVRFHVSSIEDRGCKPRECYTLTFDRRRR